MAHGYRWCGQSGLAALFIVGFASTSASQAAADVAIRQRLESGKPVTIVCFGDSITGIYYHTGGRRAYPEMLEIALKSALPRAKVKVVNAGISGHTTREALARIDRDVLKHKPDLVTVMFGMNDIARMPLEQFKKNLLEIKERCEKAGAGVLLCTQNNVVQPGPRSSQKLAEATKIIRELAREHGLLLADCHERYETLKARDHDAWRSHMSDEIHPNMDGHKILAETIAASILGKEVSLQKFGPPQPALPRILSLLRSGKAIKILAMSPYDELIGPAFAEATSDARVEVVSWPVEAGMDLIDIESAAKKVRGKKVDLVLIAVPAETKSPGPTSRMSSYSWILNSSLSFGLQQWDVVAVPPSTTSPKVAEDVDQFHRKLIAAQDLNMIVRRPGEESAELKRVLVRWLKEQLADDSPVKVADSPKSGGHIHPSICRTKDGTLVVVFKGPQVLMRSRSTDGGKTWEPAEPITTTAKRPEVIRPVKVFEVYPGTADTLPDDRLLVTWNYIADDKKKDGYYERALLYTISGDQGKTWSEQALIGPVEGKHLGAVRHNVLPWSDGRWLLPLRAGPPRLFDPKSGRLEVFTLISADGKQHAYRQIVRTAKGTLLAMNRDLLRSTDDGKTWSAVKNFPAAPPVPDKDDIAEGRYLTVLQDGRVLVTWGVGTKNKGLRYNVSSDDGVTWTQKSVTLLPDMNITARYYSARTVPLDEQHVGTVFLSGSSVYFLQVAVDRLGK